MLPSDCTVIMPGESNLISGGQSGGRAKKELSCNFKKYDFAHPLKLWPTYLFKLVHFIIFCFYLDI